MGYRSWEATTHWLPGTLLTFQDYSPSSNMVSQFYQVGLACVTPNRIPGLWNKYARQQATLEQVREGVLSDGEVDDGNKNED